MRTTSATLVGGLTFPESPRWHDGRLWYLDLPSYSLHAVTLDGHDELIEQLDDRPATFDFLPDGTPAVAMQHQMRIVRAGDRSLYADLTELEHRGSRFWKFGDMVIDGQGRLYIGCKLPPDHPAHGGDDGADAVVLVTPDGGARVVDGCRASPNGMAVTDDGGRLIVAESMRSRLTEWAVSGDGSLTGAHVFAELGTTLPDGICVDREGACWVAGLHTGEVTRVSAGGRVLESVKAAEQRFPVAAMLGGPDRRHLFVLSCAAPAGRVNSWEDCIQATGYVEVVEVDVPGAGWPAN